MVIVFISFVDIMWKKINLKHHWRHWIYQFEISNQKNNMMLSHITTDLYRNVVQKTTHSVLHSLSPFFFVCNCCCGSQYIQYPIHIRNMAGNNTNKQNERKAERRERRRRRSIENMTSLFIVVFMLYAWIFVCAFQSRKLKTCALVWVILAQAFRSIAIQTVLLC